MLKTTNDKLIHMSLIFVAIIFILNIPTKLTAEQLNDPVLLIFGFAKDTNGNIVGHVQTNVLKSEWSAMGDDMLAAQVEAKYKVTKFTKRTVSPGKCFVIYSKTDSDGKTKMSMAIAEMGEKHEKDKERINRYVIEGSGKTRYRYIEDGCNLNESVAMVNYELRGDSDAFAEQIAGLTLEQGKFLCKGQENSYFNVRRYRPGVYGFKDNNGGFFKLDMRKAINPDASISYIAKARDQYHSALKMMCGFDKPTDVSKDLPDYFKIWFGNRLNQEIEDCESGNKPEKECEALKIRLKQAGSVHG